VLAANAASSTGVGVMGPIVPADFGGLPEPAPPLAHPVARTSPSATSGPRNTRLNRPEGL